MNAKRTRHGRDFRLLEASLIAACVGALVGCGDSVVSGTSLMDGGTGVTGNGGSAGGVVQTGGTTSTGSGGSVTSNGGSTGSGGGSTGGVASGTGGSATSTGGTSPGSGGTPSTGGAGTATGGSGGTTGSTGGTTSTGGSADSGQPMSQTCTNAPHVLPLNASNAQDGITLGNFYVDTDTWNAANYTVSQTMYVCDYNNWYVVANMNNDSGDGAVKTYPDVHEDFNSSPEISSFTSITSSFAHTAPHVGIYEFAYDIWLNGVATNGSTEVMIWTDNYNQVPSGSVQETVTFDNQSYKVYKSGSYIAFVETTNVTSGTVNLLTFFNHIISKGWIPSTSTVGAIDYGIEIVSTDGHDATFAVNDFSLTTN